MKAPHTHTDSLYDTEDILGKKHKEYNKVFQNGNYAAGAILNRDSHDDTWETGKQVSVHVRQMKLCYCNWGWNYRVLMNDSCKSH